MRKYYERLLVLFILVIGVTATLYFTVLRHRIAKTDSLAVMNRDLQQGLYERNANWKLDPDYLSNLNMQYERYRIDSLNLLCEVFQRANRQFKELYDEHNNNISVREWMDSLLVFHYEDIYLKVREKLARPPNRIYLYPEILKLQPNEVVPREGIYRLVAQMFLVNKIATLMSQHQLRLSDREMFEEYVKEKNLNFTTKDGKSIFPPEQPPALISVLPTRAYYLNDQKTHFLDEYPIAVRCRGQMRNLVSFLHTLTVGDNFMSVKSFRIRAIGYKNFQNLATVRVRNEEIEADMVISGFLVVKDVESLKKEQVERVQRKRKLLPGA